MPPDVGLQVRTTPRPHRQGMLDNNDDSNTVFRESMSRDETHEAPMLIVTPRRQDP